jgi:hypothetical protein
MSSTQKFLERLLQHPANEEDFEFALMIINIYRMLEDQPPLTTNNVS